MKYKSISEYLELPWTYQVEQYNDDGVYFVVYVNELPGCMTHGETPNEAFSNIKEAIQSHIESMIEDEESVPEPIKPDDFKGTITYRTKPEKHYKLAKEAQRKNTSINKLIDQAMDDIISA